MTFSFKIVTIQSGAIGDFAKETLIRFYLLISVGDLMSQIIFDETHDEAVNINDDGVSGFLNYSYELKKLGYKVRKTEKALSLELESPKVLVVAFPKREFKIKEREEIKDFVESGNGLFLLGEWANLHNVSQNLNMISKQFNIEFRNDRLTDFDDAYSRDAEMMKTVLGVGRMPYMIKLVDFTDHPITRDVKSIGYFAGCTLETDSECALVWTDESCFGDHRIDEYQQISEASGPFILAAARNVGKGKVVCIGDTSPFSNRFIVTEDNARFGTQIIKWLAGDL